jgi:hypothetical protein
MNIKAFKIKPGLSGTNKIYISDKLENLKRLEVGGNCVYHTF